MSPGKTFAQTSPALGCRARWEPWQLCSAARLFRWRTTSANLGWARHEWLATHGVSAQQAAGPPTGLPPLGVDSWHLGDPLALHGVAVAPILDGDLAKLETLVLRSI